MTFTNMMRELQNDDNKFCYDDIVYDFMIIMNKTQLLQYTNNVYEIPNF